jgi:hypothetical protein
MIQSQLQSLFRYVKYAVAILLVSYLLTVFIFVKFNPAEWDSTLWNGWKAILVLTATASAFFIVDHRRSKSENK